MWWRAVSPAIMLDLKWTHDTCTDFTRQLMQRFHPLKTSTQSCATLYNGIAFPITTSIFSSGVPQDFMSPHWDDSLLWLVRSMVKCPSRHSMLITLKMWLARAMCYPDLETFTLILKCQSWEGKFCSNLGSGPYVRVQPAIKQHIQYIWYMHNNTLKGYGLCTKVGHRNAPSPQKNDPARLFVSYKSINNLFITPFQLE